MAYADTLSTMPETGIAGHLLARGEVICAITAPSPLEVHLTTATPLERARTALRERAEAHGLERLGAKQLTREARRFMNLGLTWLRNALEPIIHLIAQKLLDAQATVAAADAL